MKNDNHPLIRALNKNKPQGPAMVSFPEMPRMIEVTAKDIPDLKLMKPGSELHLNVNGTIKSMRDDGSVMVEISDVTNSAQDEQEAEQEPNDAIVTTQESHVP